MSDYSLEKIASAQRGVIACVGINILLIILAKIATNSDIILLAAIALAVVAIIFIAKLTSALRYSTAVIVLSCIATCIPLISLIVLLVLNGKATAILKEHGVKVGLFGADLKG